MKERVLIVDDDSAVRESVRKVLQAAGYQVVVASDGEEATNRFVPGQIDLVLLDLNLPFRSGWDVFERITTWYPSVPVIIVTGLPDQFPTARAAGVGALMEKPLDVSALLKTMDDLLAEPEEARLRRLCGYQSDTRHFHRPSANPTGRLPPPVTRSHRQRHPRGAQRWGEQ